jgi:hypothetical protein
MKTSLTPICTAVAITLAALSTAGSAQAQILIADNFQNPTFSTTNNFLVDYQLNGQSGLLAPLSYTSDVGASTWRTQVTAQPFNATNTVVRAYGQNQSTVFGYSTNFEYDSMSISVDLAQGEATWAALTIGSSAPASQDAGSLFQVRQVNQDTINVFGNGLNFLTSFTNGVNSGFNLNTIRVGFTTPAAYDGSGFATLDLFVNNVQADLNGESAGLSYTREGFTDNFISFSTQHGNSFGSGLVDNISIVPEPSTVLLLGVGATVVAFLRRRR